MSEKCASNETNDDTKPSEDDQDNETDENDLDKEADDIDLPIDRGWAWMILAGAYLNSVLVVGMLRLEGIFFNQYQKQFQSSSGVTSLITSVQNGVYSLFSLIVMLVGSARLSTRVSLIIGGLLNSVAYLINSRSTRIEYVIIGQGVLSVNLVDYMGMEKLGSCLGFTNLIHGVSISILFTTLGSLRDISGSYVSSFHLVGSFLLLSFLINMSTPFVERWVNKRKAAVTRKEKANLNEKE